MKTNPLLDLESLGQSIWVDDICRGTIKVLDTPEGIPAIQQLSSEGINHNFTLLFGPPGYGEAAAADQVLKDISSVGIDLDPATEQPEDEEVAKFSEPFEQLMATLRKEWAAVFQVPANP
jgi:transaldolase